MKIFVSPKHSLHWLKVEFSLGQAKPCFETPSRVEVVIDQLKERQVGKISMPDSYPIEHITKIHSSDYIDFLQTCWAEWEQVAGPDTDALASVFFRPDQRHRKPDHIEGKLGYYSGDLTAGLGRDSWQAIKSSADSALSGADCILRDERAAFSLCRPAGHHASKELMAGYCYVNNAAVAAQYLRDNGCTKVAILDIDYHHGNGTQSIFYERGDVFCVSIHGDPHCEYPFYLGYADEQGEGKGVGYNLNLPLPLGTTTWNEYSVALNTSIKKIADYAPNALVVSLGVDTYEGDAISHFKLKSGDFLAIGTMLEAMKLPTLFVFEGGYGGNELGLNTVNVLEAFDQAANN